MSLIWPVAKWGSALVLALALFAAGVPLLWAVVAELGSAALVGAVWLGLHEHGRSMRFRTWWNTGPLQRSKAGKLKKW